jgi:long-chain acyl-CoA synthetase
MQDIKKVSEDIAELKPTFFVGVPRVFDRITTGLSFLHITETKR